MTLCECLMTAVFTLYGQFSVNFYGHKQFISVVKDNFKNSLSCLNIFSLSIRQISTQRAYKYFLTTLFHTYKRTSYDLPWLLKDFSTLLDCDFVIEQIPSIIIVNKL